MRLLRRYPFLRSRRCGHAARATVVAHFVHRDIVDGDVVHHGLVVRVVNDGGVHIVDRGVVVIPVAVPTAADVTHADVAETVIDAAVESDVRTPVTGVPTVPSADEPPIAGSPQHTHPGRLNPGAGDPVIIVAVPMPVSRRPEVSILRTGRLLVIG